MELIVPSLCNNPLQDCILFLQFVLYPDYFSNLIHQSQLANETSNLDSRLASPNC